MDPKKVTGGVSRFNSKSRSVLLASAAGAVVLSLQSVGLGQAITPIGVSGWNVNSVYSSDGGVPSASFDANNGYNLFAKNALGNTGNVGLPSGGTITSQANSNTAYQFQTFNGTTNSVFELNNNSASTYGPGYSTTGTLTLNAPGHFNTLSFLNASANGSINVNYTLNFTNGTSAPADTFTSQDWYNSGAVAISNIGRVSTSYLSFYQSYPQYLSDLHYTLNYAAQNAMPGLFETDISVPSADLALSLASITFTIPSSGTSQFNLFAVSGAVVPYVFTGAASSVINNTSINFSLGGTASNFSGGVMQFDDTAGSGPFVLSVAAGGVSPSEVVFNNTSATYTINGPGGFTGTGGLAVTGGGTVTLNNSNSYTGPTSVTAGTLILGSTGSLATGEVDVSSGATFTVNSGGSLTSSSLVLNDSGMVNYNGTALSVATLSGSGTLNLKGTALTVTQSGNFSGGIVDTATGASLTVNLPSTNTLILSGSNSYGGGTNLAGGILLLGNASSIGTGPLALQGGAIGTTGTNVTLANKVTGSVLVLADGTGVLELSNSTNTFSGPVIIQGSGNSSGGTLKIDSPGALGTATTLIVGSGGAFESNSTAANMGAGASLQISGVGVTGANGSGGALLGGDNQASVWAGSVMAVGPSNIQSGAATSGPASLTLTGSISGSGPVVFTGSPLDTASGGTIIVAPAAGQSNTYTGETQLVGEANTTAGTTLLKLGANDGLSTASGLNIVAGGSPQNVNFDLAGFNQSIQYLSGSAQTGYAIVNSGSRLSTLTISNGSTGITAPTSGVAITGNIAVVKSGVGTQILSGTSTYTGGTTVSAGTLSVATSNALGTGAVTLKGGTLNLGGGGGTTVPLINGLSNSLFTTTTNGQGSNGISGSTLSLTDPNQGGEATSAFTNTPISLSTGFVASFQYTVTSRYAASGDPHFAADGFGFVLQNVGANALGQGGGALGFGTIGSPSAGVLTNIYDYNNTPGTGFLTNGAQPQNGQNSSFTNYDPDLYDLEYDNTPVTFGVTLTYNATAGVITQVMTSNSVSYTNNISTGSLSAILGANTAYVGFTGSDGYDFAGQSISNFTYSIFVSGPTSIANNVIAAPSTSSVIELSVAAGYQSGAIGTLNIGSGALVKLTAMSTDAGATTHGILTTTGLTIAGATGHWTGTLDLTNNALDVQGGSLATLTNQVKQGYANGTWQGSGGITSSAAAADSLHLTAIGVITNDNPLQHGTPLYGSGGGIASTFDGATPADGDILLKYTFYGDANLSGTVDGSDYAIVDNTYLSEAFVNGVATKPVSGWYFGDFNYDGVVDGSDYTLMDNAFNQQGASLAAQVATATDQIAGTSVPEPASLSLIAITATGLLSRRRNSRTLAPNRCR